MPGELAAATSLPDWTTPALTRAVAGLPAALSKNYRHWRLPPAPRRNVDLAALIDDDGGDDWFDLEKTESVLAMMASRHRLEIEARRARGDRHVGTLFRRMRRDVSGRSAQRAEARFDGIAGCLRTPAGGSSRQVVVLVDEGAVRMRLLRPREAARLMGLPDSYRLPRSASAALKLTGDGVCVPVVAFLADHLLAPLARR